MRHLRGKGTGVGCGVSGSLVEQTSVQFPTLGYRVPRWRDLGLWPLCVPCYQRPLLLHSSSAFLPTNTKNLPSPTMCQVKCWHWSSFMWHFWASRFADSVVWPVGYLKPAYRGKPYLPFFWWPQIRLALRARLETPFPCPFPSCQGASQAEPNLPKVLFGRCHPKAWTC